MKTLITLSLFLVASLSSAQTFSQELSLLGATQAQVLEVVPDGLVVDATTITRQNDIASHIRSKVLFDFNKNTLNSIWWISLEHHNVDEVFSTWYECIDFLNKKPALFLTDGEGDKPMYLHDTNKLEVDGLLSAAKKGTTSFYVVAENEHGLFFFLHILAAKDTSSPPLILFSVQPDQKYKENSDDKKGTLKS